MVCVCDCSPPLLPVYVPTTLARTQSHFFLAGLSHADEAAEAHLPQQRATGISDGAGALWWPGTDEPRVAALNASRAVLCRFHHECGYLRVVSEAMAVAVLVVSVRATFVNRLSALACFLALPWIATQFEVHHVEGFVTMNKWMKIRAPAKTAVICGALRAALDRALVFKLDVSCRVG